MIRTKDLYDAFRRGGYPDAVTGAILAQLARRLTAHVRRRQPGLHDADVHDCVQETICRFLARPVRYDPARPVWHWVFRIARNVVCEKVRLKRRTQTSLRNLAQAPRPERLDHGRVAATLHEALTALYEKSKLDRKTIEAGWDALLGEPAVEVHAKHGLPCAGVYLAKHRVLRTLQRLAVAGHIRA
jgi:hypothetical protein